jgi:hypothetical protein
MRRLKALHDALGVAAAMLALIVIAAVTFALAIWGAVATVVP